MYLKQIFLLQCLLFLVSLAEKEPEPIFHYLNHRHLSIDESLIREWNNNETPIRPGYCQCDYHGCQCCEKYRNKAICLVILQNLDSDRRGLFAIVKIGWTKVHKRYIKNRDGQEFNLNISGLIAAADLTFRMYDFSVRDYDMLTFSVKIRILIGRRIDYVCDLGTYTLMIPAACEDFLLPGPHFVTRPPVVISTPNPHLEEEKEKEKEREREREREREKEKEKEKEKEREKAKEKAKDDADQDVCLVVECGRSSLNYNIGGRIMNGVEAQIGELPWMVHFTYWDKINFDCSGVLLDCSWILTTVHCTYYITENRILNFNVTAGGINLFVHEPKQRTRQFTHVIHHPQNKISHNTNNIALVKMNRPIEFNKYIQPICLPALDHNFEGQSCIISGWGMTEKKKLSSILLKSDSVIYSKDECKKSGILIYDTHICAGTEYNRADSGDNGAPLQCIINDRFYVAGLYALDFETNHKHRFRYERVSAHIKWIHETMIKY